MSERLRRALGAALIPTVAMGLAVVAVPGYSELALHVWLLLVLAIGLTAVLAAVRAVLPPRPSSFDSALSPRPQAQARPPSLAKLEREVSMGAENAFDTHFRLRPLFRELTGGVLLTRHGVDLQRHPERARALVGDELWALVRPDVDPPVERSAPGVPVAAIEAAVTDLERIAWT